MAKTRRYRKNRRSIRGAGQTMTKPNNRKNNISLVNTRKRQSRVRNIMKYINNNARLRREFNELLNSNNMRNMFNNNAEKEAAYINWKKEMQKPPSPEEVALQEKMAALKHNIAQHTRHLGNIQSRLNQPLTPLTEEEEEELNSLLANLPSNNNTK